MTNTKLYVIEGNIAAGKSTLLERIRNECDSVNGKPVKLWDEPLTDYLNMSSKECPTPVNLLNYFYDDRRGHSFGFQLVSLIAHHKNMSLALNNNCMNIFERGILSNKNVFCKMAPDQGFISDIQWMEYNYIYECLN